ncbi:MAG TPA: hypothetical protein VGD98_10225 [Ktedonobacteraceae bacterium]
MKRQSRAEKQIQELQERITRQNIAGIQEIVAIYQAKYAQQLEAFTEELRAIKEQLTDLSTLAARQAQWPYATLQLHASLEQIEGISRPDAPAQDIIQQISQRLDLKAEEHITWLQRLNALHQQKNDVEQEITGALAQESEKQTAVISLLEAFEKARSHFLYTMQDIHQLLEKMLISSQLLTASELALTGNANQAETTPRAEKERAQPFGKLDKDGLLTTEPTRYALEAMIDIFSLALVRLQQTIEDQLIEISIRDVYYTEIQQQSEQQEEEQENPPTDLTDARQRELAALHARLLNITSQLDTLHQNLSQAKEKRDELQKALAQLQKMHIISQLDEAYSDAQAKYLLLEQAQKYLQEARTYTAQKRMQHAMLIGRLEEASFSHPLFLQHHTMVRAALQAAEYLTLAIPFLRRDLRRLTWLCQDSERSGQLITQAEKTRDLDLSLLQQFRAQLLPLTQTTAQLELPPENSG